ncbi:MAG TPA: BTAD domain-containing putative transcriptional regulator [Gemmatimonadales bacterium]
MFRLRTLGGVNVVDQQGELLTGAATQRRLLALLVALAVAGERGFSRDKLMALLWPDAGEERARHSLTQALYAARRALRIDDLFEVGGDIRLNRARLGSDVQDLQEALDVGDDERAVALYSGAFADGFFLPGSGEFEQWISLQRARLEERIVSALERLAQRDEEAGRGREALQWRKRLAAIRPLDASAAVALMTSLAHAGDRAGALQHARLHETMLREELGLAPDPVVTSLAARLREPVEWAAEMPLWAIAEETTATETAPSPEVVPEPSTIAPRTELALAEPARPARPRIGWWWVVAGAVLTGFLALFLRRNAAPAPTRQSAASLDQNVVVAPFRVAGASASLAYLREGMVELLSTRLADDSGARSVDAGAVLAAWRAAALGTPTDVPRDTVLRLAASLGAERLVVGSIVGTPSRMVVTASVIEVASQQTSGRATVEGPADSITALVDRLAARILVAGAGEDVTLSDQTTESLRALRSYLGGQASFRRGSYSLALRQYEEALRLDSTFALAAVQLARTADRLRTVRTRTRALGLAWRGKSSLDARARALLLALAGPDYPSPSPADEQVAAWERLVDLTPDRAEAWFEFGSRLALEGTVAGEADSRSRAVVALQRALRLEPNHAPSRELLHQLAIGYPGAAAQPDAEEAAAMDSALPLGPFLQWRRAIAQGDSTTVRRIRDSLPQLGPRNLQAIAVAAQAEIISLGDARRAVQQLRARATRLDEQLDATLADHALALNQGRLHDTESAVNRLRELQPGTHAHLRLRVLDAVYDDGDTAAAAAAARELQRGAAVRRATDPATRAVQQADACVLAQWTLQQRDTTGIQHAIGGLQADSLFPGLPALPVATGSLACAELLHAWLAVELHQANANVAVARLDTLAFTVGPSGDAIFYAPLLIARLHQRLGDSGAALQAIRRRENLVGWPRYLASAWREEGRYAMLAGAPAEARDAFAHYLILRSPADPELREVMEQVRREMAAAQTPAP